MNTATNSHGYRSDATLGKIVKKKGLETPDLLLNKT
jgi:hypothetical protein